jgi:hypothetical protein
LLYNSTTAGSRTVTAGTGIPLTRAACKHTSCCGAAVVIFNSCCLTCAQQPLHLSRPKLLPC